MIIKFFSSCHKRLLPLSNCLSFRTTVPLFADNENTLSSYHKFLQKEAHDFAEHQIQPYLLRTASSSSIFPNEIIKNAGKLGYGGVCGANNYGGRMSGKLGAALIFEALAETDIGLSAYISIHNMLGIAIEDDGTEELKSLYLKKLFNMDFIGAYCLTEPNSGSDAISLKATASIENDEFVINGTKSLVIGAGVNHLFLIFCLTGAKEISAILVNSDNKGIKLGNNDKKMGFDSVPIRDVYFTDCRVPRKNLIGKQGHGFKIAMKVLTAQRINIASCAVGGASNCLKKTIRFLKNSKENSSEQARYKIAELSSKLLACKLIVRQTASALDEKNPNAALYSSLAKSFVPIETFEIINECIDIYQEKAIFSQNESEKFLRDVRALQFAGGTIEIMKHSLQRELLK